LHLNKERGGNAAFFYVADVIVLESCRPELSNDYRGSGDRRMKIPELRHALAALGLQRRAVSMDGVEVAEEQYRLGRDGGFWTAYHARSQ
jgi:hypothetical protein